MRIFAAALVLCALTAPALAGEAVPMLLELWRNGATDHALLHVTVKDGAPLLAAADFPLLGVKVTAPTGDPIDLGKLPGIQVTLDQTGQRLLLTAPASLLPRQLYDLGAGAATPQSDTGAERGAILRYDLSGTAADLRRFGQDFSGGASLGLDLFEDHMRASNAGFVTLGTGGRAVRLDSSFTLDRPESLTHLSFGDAINVTPDWGRAIRFGGVEYASDFSLAPGLVTMPLPSFFGSSDVPASVQVFDGAAQLAERDVAPGPFEIRNLPIVTGGGAATVVVRDVLGRETTQSLSLFTDKGLLTPGLTSFAVDLGFARHNMAWTVLTMTRRWRPPTGAGA
jgi:outer membrane usher protein